MVPAPSLFVSHGSPMFALRPGELGPRLRALGAQLPEPAAVLVVSPHWQTDGLRITTAARPATLHDFGGFPAALYGLDYPAPGAPALAAAVARELAAAGHPVAPDPQRGLDHGAWVPLRHLYPDARVPVIQLSMPRTLGAADALQLGAALAPLRAQGILLLGSGSLTHNLDEFRRPVAEPGYVARFADWIAGALTGRDRAALLDYRERAPQARRAHPSEEHLLPLFVAFGASGAQEPLRRLAGGIADGVLSMDSFAWGAAAAHDREPAAA
jgi:4,5-DOPA dioxygenase extradiol